MLANHSHPHALKQMHGSRRDYWIFTSVYLHLLTHLRLEYDTFHLHCISEKRGEEAQV